MGLKSRKKITDEAKDKDDSLMIKTLLNEESM